VDDVKSQGKEKGAKGGESSSRRWLTGMGYCVPATTSALLHLCEFICRVSGLQSVRDDIGGIRFLNFLVTKYIKVANS